MHQRRHDTVWIESQIFRLKVMRRFRSSTRCSRHASPFPAKTTRTLKDCTEFHSCQSRSSLDGAELLRAVPPRHKKVDRQFGSDLPGARDLKGCLAHGGELVAHAAIIVVIGDLGIAGAASLTRPAQSSLSSWILPRSIHPFRIGSINSA